MNYPLYLVELKKKKASTSGTSGIFTIELFSFPKSNSWIYDTGYGTRICNTIQGLKGYRKLIQRILDMYVGNGNSATVEAIGSFDLILPSGMILVLDNYNGAILVSKDNVFYFNAIPRDGIFEIDMHNLSARIPQAPERYGFYIDAEEHELGDHGEPPKYRAALSDLKSKKWLEAMNVEMQSMKDTQVWNLVDLPPNCKTVRSKWLFKKKTDMDGNIYTYKARLVAKGFTQTYRFDYEETFSPVADIKAIRILIAIVVYYDYEIWQMDVKTAFLNGRLNEDVYMVQPEEFVNPKHPERVCKLQRSIYGLKQASRS
ncbi:putative retrotransposon ty1-copia subclass protein [Tanacetum coccineum]